MAHEAVQSLRDGYKGAYTTYVSEMYAHGLTRAEVEEYLVNAGINDVDPSILSPALTAGASTSVFAVH